MILLSIPRFVSARPVTFQYGNLIRDDYPQFKSGIFDMDLILCRNVFIYFDRPTVAQVVDKFCQTLQEGGYLLTGHAEMLDLDLSQLNTLSFPESVIYQRPLRQQVTRQIETRQSGDRPQPQKRSTPLGQQTLRPSTSPKASPARETFNSASRLDRAEQRFQQGRYAEAIALAQTALSDPSQSFRAHYLTARAYAKRGDWTRAKDYCQQALHRKPEAIDPLYLLAHMAEDRGDSNAVKTLYRKIIYLAPKSVSAYVELGDFCDRDRASKLYETARELLQELPHDAAIDYRQEKISRDKLLSHIEERLSL